MVRNSKKNFEGGMWANLLICTPLVTVRLPQQEYSRIEIAELDHLKPRLPFLGVDSQRSTSLFSIFTTWEKVVRQLQSSNESGTLLTNVYIALNAYISYGFSNLIAIPLTLVQVKAKIL